MNDETLLLTLGLEYRVVDNDNDGMNVAGDILVDGMIITVLVKMLMLLRTLCTVVK